MKYSIKSDPPKSYLDWISRASDAWSPVYSDLQNPEKQDVRNSLFIEQGGVCGYCGRGLRSDGSDSHIEHFRPQTKYNCNSPPDLTLEYKNFVLSCGRGVAAAQKSLPRTCGSHKGEWFDENGYISPWDTDCEKRFTYGATGTIGTAQVGDVVAQTMITILHLDHHVLNAERAIILKELEDLISTGTIQEGDLATEFAVWTTLTAGALPSFGHVAVRYLQVEFGL